jgi:GntR family transcriptional regulator
MWARCEAAQRETRLHMRRASFATRAALIRLTALVMTSAAVPDTRSTATPRISRLPELPLHARIQRELRARILDGRHPPMSRLPSESELCARYRASRITVRTALGNLQKEGLIFTLQGKGSFVAKPKTYQDVTQLTGLAESLSARGYEVLNQLQALAFRRAEPTVAERLALPPKSRVCTIRRLRLVNREPVSLELTWLPEELGRQLQRADLATRDIFLVLENDCGVALGHADLAIDATLADAELAQALRIDEGAPVLRIERLTHDAGGRPIDYELLYYRADAFQYRLRAQRRSTAP